MMRSVTLGSCVVLALAGGAAASAEPFAGPHIEAVVGWSHSGESQSHRPDLQHDSLVYGGSAGYDIRSGNLVVGANAELGRVASSKCVDLGATGHNSDEDICTKGGLNGFVGGRAGYVVGGKLLLYGIGGYANVRSSGHFTAVNVTPFGGKFHDSASGYRIGAGAEFALTPHMFVRGEYRYTDAGHIVGSQQSQLVAAIGYRF